MKYSNLPKYAKGMVDLKLRQFRKSAEDIKDLDIDLYSFIKGDFLGTTKRRYSAESRISPIAKEVKDYFFKMTGKRYKTYQEYAPRLEKLEKILESLVAFKESTLSGDGYTLFENTISEIVGMFNDMVYEKDELYSKEFAGDSGLHFAESIYTPEQIETALERFKRSNMIPMSKDWIKYLCRLYGMNYAMCPVILLEKDYVYSQSYLFVRFISSTMYGMADTNDMFSALAVSLGATPEDLEKSYTPSPKSVTGKESRKYFEDILDAFMARVFGREAYTKALYSIDKTIAPYTEQWYAEIKSVCLWRSTV